MKLDVFVKWWQTSAFNNCLLRYSIFVRPKLGTILNVTSQHLLPNFDTERESWGTVQESTENQNILKYRKIIYAHELVDTIICVAPLTANWRIIN